MRDKAKEPNCVTRPNCLLFSFQCAKPRYLLTKLSFVDGENVRIWFRSLQRDVENYPIFFWHLIAL